MDGGGCGRSRSVNVLACNALRVRQYGVTRCACVGHAWRYGRYMPRSIDNQPGTLRGTPGACMIRLVDRGVARRHNGGTCVTIDTTRYVMTDAIEIEMLSTAESIDAYDRILAAQPDAVRDLFADMADLEDGAKTARALARVRSAVDVTPNIQTRRVTDHKTAIESQEFWDGSRKPTATDGWGPLTRLGRIQTAVAFADDSASSALRTFGLALVGLADDPTVVALAWKPSGFTLDDKTGCVTRVNLTNDEGSTLADAIGHAAKVVIAECTPKEAKAAKAKATLKAATARADTAERQKALAVELTVAQRVVIAALTAGDMDGAKTATEKVVAIEATIADANANG